MRSMHGRHVLAALPALAAGIIGGAGEQRPTRQATPLTFTAVSAGGRHTCAVTAAGAAYCWGANGSGQLGDGTTTERSSPVLVEGGVRFTAVHAAGSQGADDGHTCGVTAAGAVYCWGDNSDGELGDGTKTERLSPVPVAGGVSFAAVSAGYLHNCGVTATGPAFCWGANSAGQLGDGTKNDRSNPVPMRGGVRFAAVSAGGLLHTCGVTAAGATYCWGFNRYGQLGNAVPGQESCEHLSCSTVAGGVSFVAVSARAFHTCALTAAGVAYCWGLNDRGRLGDGSTTNRSSPALVAGRLRFAAVSAGGDHTCGVTAGGAAYCWGRNSEGQLGDGTTTDQSSPVPVAGGLRFAALSAGGRHTCAVTAAGAAYCWGTNGSGQLGDGTTTAHLTPVRVAP